MRSSIRWPYSDPGGTDARRSHGAARPSPGATAVEIQAALRRLHARLQRLEERQDEQADGTALLHREGARSYEADLFRQSLSAAVANAAPAVLTDDKLGALAQFMPVMQHLNGAEISFKRRPLSTLLVPAIAFGLFAMRQPRAPTIVTDQVRNFGKRRRPVRVTMISPDGGDIRYVEGSGDVTKDSRKYEQPIDVMPVPGKKLRARAFLVLRASDISEIEFSA